MVILALLLVFQSDNTDDWIKVQPPGVGAEVQMPGTPFFSTIEQQPIQDQAPRIVRTRSINLPSGKENLAFSYHDEQETPNNRFKIKDHLDGSVTGAIALVNGEMIRNDDIFLENHKGRDFLYRCELDDAKLQKVFKLKIRSRILLVRNRLYTMNYIAEADVYDDKVAERFFKSFQIVRQPPDLPPTPRAGRARELAEAKRG